MKGWGLEGGVPDDENAAVWFFADFGAEQGFGERDIGCFLIFGPFVKVVRAEDAIIGGPVELHARFEGAFANVFFACGEKSLFIVSQPVYRQSRVERGQDSGSLPPVELSKLDLPELERLGLLGMEGVANIVHDFWNIVYGRVMEIWDRRHYEFGARWSIE